jgi:cytochrome c biogenesis protein
VWDFFASVKLSFALLLALAATSVAGTLLPQKEAAGVYLEGYGELWGRVILGLGLNDAYHAPWFYLLMVLLAANLVICSLNRLGSTLRIVRKDPAAEAARRRPPAHSFTVAGPLEAAAEKARRALGRWGPVHQAPADDGGLRIFAQKGRWSRFGVYGVHLSVLVIFAGGMVGNLWGFAGFLVLNQGETAASITLEGGRPYELGFAVRLDEFTVSYYDSGQPSEYRSEVTFLEDGRPAKEASLIVNDPAEFRGIDFYQSSYGTNPRSVTVDFRRGEESQPVTLQPRVWNQLPGGGRAGLADFREEVRMGGMYRGPLARIVYQPEGGEPVGLTAFRAGAPMPQRGPVGFEIVDFETVPYSGLQVKYDPGVWLIWVGCTLMVLGFLVTFYASHRKVWVGLAPAEGGRVRVEVAGSANKNRPALHRRLRRLAAELGLRRGEGE